MHRDYKYHAYATHLIRKLYSEFLKGKTEKKCFVDFNEVDNPSDFFYID